MEIDEIKKNGRELNNEIQNLESAKKTPISLLEPSPPNKIFLFNSIKPNFFLLKNGIVTLLKILIVSMMAFFIVDYNIELTLKISAITLLIFLTYDYFLKYSKEVKSYMKNQELDLKQTFKFEQETILYNQKIKEYLKNEIENDFILIHNAEIDKKIKILKDEINTLENLTKYIGKYDSVAEIDNIHSYDNADFNTRKSNRSLDYYKRKIQIKKDNRNMEIICHNCKHKETVNLGLFVKIIGGALPIGGFWAWTTYLLAGTGLALPIVTAMIGGGIGMLIFKDKIVKWILEKKYKCPKCGRIDWDV